MFFQHALDQGSAKLDPGSALARTISEKLGLNYLQIEEDAQEASLAVNVPRHAMRAPGNVS